jgi:hypothetical protein
LPLSTVTCSEQVSGQSSGHTDGLTAGCTESLMTDFLVGWTQVAASYE